MREVLGWSTGVSILLIPAGLMAWFYTHAYSSGTWYEDPWFWFIISFLTLMAIIVGRRLGLSNDKSPAVVVNMAFICAGSAFIVTLPTTMTAGTILAALTGATLGALFILMVLRLEMLCERDIIQEPLKAVLIAALPFVGPIIGWPLYLLFFRRKNRGGQSLGN